MSAAPTPAVAEMIAIEHDRLGRVIRTLYTGPRERLSVCGRGTFSWKASGDIGWNGRAARFDL